MAFTFLDLQTEVKRRVTRNQSGTEYDTATKNVINTSIFRIAREAPWRVLRRYATLTTDAPYSTGTVTTTISSSTWTGASTAWLTTANARKGRRIKITSSGGSAKLFEIDTITADTTLTTTFNYDITGAASLSYKILARDTYNLPIQTGRVALIWHEEYGYPFPLAYVTDRSFFDASLTFDTEGEPVMYRMWGEDYVLEQPKEASVMRIASSASGDTSKNVTVFGIVSSYPDFETITTNSSNGTTAVSGSKSFTSVERIVKDATTTGRITVDANSANTTVAVLPVGDTTAGLQYKKIQLYPIPDAAMIMKVQYYKDPYRLVSDGDVHELGHEFDEAIVLLACSRIQAEQSKLEDSKIFFGMYQDELSTLRRLNIDKLDWLPRLQRPRESRSGSSMKVHRYLTYAQVGSQYGAVSF